MNRRRLLRLLPGPADVRRRLGLAGQGKTSEAGEGRRRSGPVTLWRRWLGRALGNPALWHPTRRAVSGGVAVGLFVSWMPVPLQMLLAAVLASVLRVHVPVSVVMVWFTNPLTIGPLLYAAWRTGSTLLGRPPSGGAESTATGPQAPEDTSLELASEAVTALTPGAAEPSRLDLPALLAGIGDAWPTLLAGCLFLAACSAVTGFLTVRLLWRALAVRRWRLRRRPGSRTPPAPTPSTRVPAARTTPPARPRPPP